MGQGKCEVRTIQFFSLIVFIDAFLKWLCFDPIGFIREWSLLISSPLISGLRMAASVDNLLAVRGANQSQNPSMEEVSERSVTTGGSGSMDSSSSASDSTSTAQQPPQQPPSAVAGSSSLHHRDSNTSASTLESGTILPINQPCNVHVRIIVIMTIFFKILVKTHSFYPSIEHVWVGNIF